MFYLLILKSKPRTTSPNVFCLGDGIGVTSQFSVEEVMGWLCCARIHWNSKLFYCGLWHFTTVIMQNLTFYAFFAGHEKSFLFSGLESGLLFLAEEDMSIRFLWLKRSPPSLTSVWSRRGALLGEATAKGNWEIAVYVMEESKLMDKSTAIRRKPCLPSKVLGEEECLISRKYKRLKFPWAARQKPDISSTLMPAILFWSNIFHTRGSSGDQEK